MNSMDPFKFKPASQGAIAANVARWRQEHQLDDAYKPLPKRKEIRIKPHTGPVVKASENKIVLDFNPKTGEFEVAK